MKRFLVMLMCFLLALTPLSFAGCDCSGGVGEQEAIDPTRTQLRLSILKCGVGTTFGYQLKADYEKLNPNVQVLVYEATGEGDGPQMQTLMKNSDRDVVFMVNWTLSDYVNVGLKTSDIIADITDIVTTPRVAGEKSLHEKIHGSQATYHNVGTEENPVYFSLPWYTSFMSTTYDVKLFRDENLFELDGYAGLDCVAGTEDDQWGPDGEEGTYDDGFPATWEDMKVLLQEMKTVGIIPFTWTAFEGYLDSWMANIWASYEGADNYSILQTFDGTYKSSNKPDQVVTPQTGYLMAQQNGKLAALKTLEYIMRNGMYTQKSLDSGYGHLVCQKAYINSSYNQQPVAFINEGNYWENEARAFFDEMATYYGAEYAYGTREFAVFPWPKYIGSSATEGIPNQINTKSTLLAGVVRDMSNVVVINKRSAHLDLAKDFLQWAYSDQNNANFLRDSGMLRPFGYDKSIITDDYLDSLTPYQRSVYEYTQENDNVEIITGANRTGLIQKAGDFIRGLAAFSIKMPAAYGNSKYTTASDVFNTYPTFTAQNYFDQMANVYTEADWTSRFFRS